MESLTKHCPEVSKAAHKEQTEQLIPGDKPADLSLQLRNDTYLYVQGILLKSKYHFMYLQPTYNCWIAPPPPQLSQAYTKEQEKCQLKY